MLPNPVINRESPAKHLTEREIPGWASFSSLPSEVGDPQGRWKGGIVGVSGIKETRRAKPT